MESSDLLPKRLRLARESAGLSQAQVAKRMDLHRPTITEIEAGRRKVSAEELAGFSRLYGVSVSWLLDSKIESGDYDTKLKVAARQLSRIKPEELDKLIELLSMLRLDEGTES